MKTCVGSDFCRFGVGDSTALGIALEERFQGLASPAKMTLAVTGCPRNCAEALCKDVGVVAIEGGDGGRWEIYVGGAAGAHIRKGDLLATVDSAAEVMTLTGRFLQYYRENANWLERTYGWVPRLGIDAIARSWSTTPRASPRISMRRWRNPLGPTVIHGSTARSPRPRASSGRRCRCSRCPRFRFDDPAHHRGSRRLGSTKSPSDRAARSRSTASRSRSTACATAPSGALGAICPHRGGPLADGLADDDVVVCPLHGRTYDLTSGAETAGSGPGVCSHPVTTDGDGSIRLTLDCG